MSEHPQDHQAGRTVVRGRGLRGLVAGDQEHVGGVGEQGQDAFDDREALQQPVAEERANPSYDGVPAGRHREAELHVAVDGGAVGAEVGQRDRFAPCLLEGLG